MSMEGGASGSSAVADAAMAEAGAVDPDLALGVFFSTFSLFADNASSYVIYLTVYVFCSSRKHIITNPG